jgi:hypothetical protein
MWIRSAAIVLALALVPTACALACMQDADCDNGDSCSQPDTCVSGSCVLGGGGDADDDLICDAERDPYMSFNVTRTVIKKKTLAIDNSAAKGSGDFFIPPGSPAGAFTGAGGFSIRVKDQLSDAPPAGDGIDATVSWPPETCVTKSNGVVTCRTPDKRSFIRFKPNPIGEGQYRFKYKLKGLGDLAGPFFGPVRIVLTRGGNRRAGDTVVDCKLILAGLTCREF